MKTIGKYIRDLRKQSGLSQGDLAKQLGYSTAQFISNWERDVAPVPLMKIRELHKLIGGSVTDFKSILISSYKKKVDEEV